MGLLTTGCSKVDCERYCRQLSEQELLLTPYKLSDTVYLVNSIDTFNIICTSRNYFDSVDTYADHYIYDYCDGVQKTYFWQQTTKLTSNIPYTDSTSLEIEINTRTRYEGEEGIFTLKLFDNNYSDVAEQYSFLTRVNDQHQLYKELFHPDFFHCDLTFVDEIELQGHNYKNVNILFDGLINIDSVYYNSEYGIIRIVSNNFKFHILN